MRRGASATLTLALAALLAAAAVVVMAPVARAHSSLIGSTPMDGAALATAPRQVVLTFDEPVRRDATVVTLQGSDGTALALRPDAGTAPEATVVTVPLPPLDEGVVRLRWETTSAVDRHSADGVLAFGIGGVGVPRDPAPLSGAEPMDATARAASYAGLALLLGAAAFVLVLRRRVPGREDWARRAQLVAAVGGALAVAGEIGVVVQTAAVIGVEGVRLEDLGVVIWSGYGVRMGARLLGLALMLVALIPLRGRSRLAPWALGAAAVLAVGTQAATGHVAGHGDALAVPALAVHVAALAAWVGGVVCLAVIALTSVRDEVDRVHARRLLAGFAWLAFPAVALVAVSGLVLTAYQVATPDALLTTPYGRTLLVKLALVGAAGLLGLRHALLLHGRAATHDASGMPGRAGLGLEAAALLGAVVVAGALSASAPPRGPEWTADEATSPPAVTVQPDDLVVTTAVTPGRAGANVVSVRVLDTAVPSPGPVTAVTVGLVGGAGSPAATAALSPAPDGAWTATVELVPGPLAATVRVQRGDRTPTVATAAFEVPAPGPAPRPMVVSRSPLGPVLLLLALIASLAAVALAALLLRRRRARTRRSPSVDPTVGLRPLPVPDDVSSVPVP